MRKQKKWVWHRKVMAELGRRRQNRMDLVRHLGLPQRTVYDWLDGVNRPRHFEATMEQIGAFLGWPTAYLMDDDLPYPPQVTEKDAARAFKALTPEAWEIVNALADPDAVAFLADALSGYRKMRERLGR